MNITAKNLEKLIDQRVASILRSLLEENPTGLAGLDISTSAVKRITESLEEKHDKKLHIERSIKWYGENKDGTPNTMKSILV